jgi:CDP-paratose 2-epimerase
MTATGASHGNGAARDGAVLITGGAGFIATNLARQLLDDGRQVVVFDNLSRPGVDRNLAWLRRRYDGQMTFVRGDVRDVARLRSAMRDVTEVYHLAAQVAVTTSLADPVADFEINARGTLNLLEAARQQPTPPSIVFTSTNKVYGALTHVALAAEPSRYTPVDRTVRAHGISESCGLAFHSPYGCSKGAAEQYVLDYARTFGLSAVVFRMSCIYGPHQCGTEDQGWVAHFLAEALRQRSLTLYGDGRQVRDILFVGDLVRALLLAQAHADRLAGEVFNIGGGPERAVSLLELIDEMAVLIEQPVPFGLAGWRTADQRFYVSDTRRFSAATGWTPQVSIREGLTRLVEWFRDDGVPAHGALAERSA